MPTTSDAPSCPSCKKNGESDKTFSEGNRTKHHMTFGEGPFIDEDGKNHFHSGRGGGMQQYECDCGRIWSEPIPLKYNPCWCGWGEKLQEVSEESA